MTRQGSNNESLPTIPVERFLILWIATSVLTFLAAFSVIHTVYLVQSGERTLLSATLSLTLAFIGLFFMLLFRSRVSQLEIARNENINNLMDVVARCTVTDQRTDETHRSR